MEILYIVLTICSTIITAWAFIRVKLARLEERIQTLQEERKKTTKDIGELFDRIDGNHDEGLRARVSVLDQRIMTLEKRQ